MFIHGIEVDMSRGFTIMRGREVICTCWDYEDAKRGAALIKGGYIRYWAVKGGNPPFLFFFFRKFRRYTPKYYNIYYIFYKIFSYRIFRQSFFKIFLKYFHS